MKNTASKLFFALICLVMLSSLQACESQVTSHGNLIEASQLNKLEIGQTRRANVEILFGPASFKGAFDDSRLYYNNQKMEAQSLAKPKRLSVSLLC